SGPATKALSPHHTISSSLEKLRHSSKVRMRCCFCLHLQGPPRALMYRFYFPLGTSPPILPTAFWQPLTMLSLPKDGADGFVMTLPLMPMWLASPFPRTARPLRVGR